jgi:hypothetical protein
MKRIFVHLSGVLFATGMAGVLAAQPVNTLRGALVEAMTGSPEVMASW